MPITNVVEIPLYKNKVNIRFFPDSHIYMVDGKRKTGVTTYIGIVDKSRALMSWKGNRIVDFLLEKLSEGKVTEEMICVPSNIDEVEKEAASVVGKSMHEWAEKYIHHLMGKGDIPDMPDVKAVQVGVNAFLDWANSIKLKPISSERVVYSKKHDYIGTLDFEAKVNNQLCLIDFKSSNGLYNTVGLQTAAYLRADEEESGKKYKGRWAVRLSKFDESEYYIKEEKKKKIKKLTCQYTGKEFNDYEIPTYQAFEAKYLDEDLGNLERDFEGFIHAKALFEWNKKTDFYLNKNK